MIDVRIVPPAVFPLALDNNLRCLGPTRKLIRHFLSGIRWHFEADSVWLYIRLRRGRRTDELVLEGDETLCDASLLEPFARLERPEIPRNMLLAPLRTHQRVVGIVGVARRSRDFEVGRGRALNRLTGLLAGELERREEACAARILERIQRKALSGLSAKDLAYQILDGLHQLIRYDHSASLLSHNSERRVFRVEAEKIVWTKAKSERIGGELTVSWSPTALLIEGSDLKQEYRELWANQGPPDTPDPRSIILTPLLFHAKPAGAVLLMVNDRVPLDDRDRQVLDRFAPVAAFCVGRRRLG